MLDLAEARGGLAEGSWDPGARSENSKGRDNQYSLTITLRLQYMVREKTGLAVLNSKLL